ncbi:prepilin peptidase [uncultured Cohaesibacter sp.]|uniref:A24 family peptidase n=1 Tax=uncultured Cohaesibacter sp. TaxID=1002546 RepID=UPI0029C7451A|nr:prepilin peptidase [uncultured Cohaesibacter sp.]
MMDTFFAWALMLFAPLVFAYAGSSDLFNMRISNRISLVLLLAFPFFAWGVEMPWMTALAHLGTSVVTLAVCYFFWSRGWIGGGDAKFAAAAALWLGPQLAIWFFAITSVYGALLALVLLLFRARYLPVFILKMDWALRLHSIKRIPYGLALAAAGLQLYSVSDWMSMGVHLAIAS